MRVGENGNAEGEHTCTGVAENMSVSVTLVSLLYVTPPLINEVPSCENSRVVPILTGAVAIVQTESEADFVYVRVSELSGRPPNEVTLVKVILVVETAVNVTVYKVIPNL
jgi:phage shock protein PspC (stress-responsive transcriptional regulator)